MKHLPTLLFILFLAAVALVGPFVAAEPLLLQAYLSTVIPPESAMAPSTPEGLPRRLQRSISPCDSIRTPSSSICQRLT